jgi:branched-chain amino acid aminotransferase
MTAIHYIDGEWLEGNPPLLGPMTHASWMSSLVFDGARAFEGVTPDLERHCERLIVSAREMGLRPPVSAGETHEIALDGVAHFPEGAELYIRPMMWAEDGFIVPDAKSTRFCCTLFEVPMPEPKGFGVHLSRFRRPTPDSAPTQAKASCLYPNSYRAMREANEQGFDNAVILDANGNVAELATANVWIVKDGAAHTPVPNGTFLNGVTRQRIANLLARDGVPVHERSIAFREVEEADEVFSTGNLGKVLPITRVGERDLQPGPVFTRARELYWDWAHDG